MKATLCVSALALLSSAAFAQATPNPFISLSGGSPGPIVHPYSDAFGLAQPGALVQLSLENAPVNRTGSLVIGASLSPVPLGPGVLQPQASLVLPIATDAAGEFELNAIWPNLPQGFPWYWQFVMYPASGTGVESLSNAIQGRTLSQAEATEWAGTVQGVTGAFSADEAIGTLPAPIGDIGALATDPRFVDLASVVATASGQTVFPGILDTTVYTVPVGATSLQVWGVPLFDSVVPGLQRGEIFVHDLTDPAGLAFAMVAGTDPANPQVLLYGPGASGVNVRLLFSSLHEYLGLELFGPNAGFAGGGEGVVGSWGDLIEWIADPTSPGSLPFGLDILCGLACLDGWTGLGATPGAIASAICSACTVAWWTQCLIDALN